MKFNAKKVEKVEKVYDPLMRSVGGWIEVTYDRDKMPDQSNFTTIFNVDKTDPVFTWKDDGIHGYLPATSWNCMAAYKLAKRMGIPVGQSLVDAHSKAKKDEERRFSGDIGDIDISMVSRKVKSAWDSYQEYGVKWLLSGKEKLLSDEQGMGKTITILGAFSERFYSDMGSRLLVVTTGIGLLNWRDECRKWLDDDIKVHVLNVGKRESGCPVEECNIVIVNYDSVDKYSSLLKSMNITHIAVDEAHHIKNPDTARAKAITGIINHIGRSKVSIWAADGTPVLKKNLDLHGILKTLMPRTLWSLGGSRLFLKKYCGAEASIIGIKKDRSGNPIIVNGKKVMDKVLTFSENTNNLELSDRFRKTGVFMYRSHEKHNPGKYTYDINIYRIDKSDISNLSDYETAERDFDSWKIANNMMDADDTEEHREDAMLQRNVLERLVGQGKIEAGIRRCAEILEVEDKLVIFAKNVDIQNAYISAFPGCMRLQSNMDASEKSRNVKEFQENPEIRVIVCSIGVAQEVINLTAAKYGFVAQYITSPKALEQVYRRLARRGQESHVTIEHIHAVNTVDDIMEEVVNQSRMEINELMRSEAEDLIMEQYSAEPTRN